MEISGWLVGIACALAALGSLWLFIRYVKVSEKCSALTQLYQQLLGEKQQLAELLSIAQKEIGALSAHKETFGQTHEVMKAEFKNTATELLKEMNKDSQKNIGDILTPLRERITEFQKNIDEKFNAQGKETHTLKAEIQRIVLQADGLTRALKGDVKVQGNWGEVILERILEASGLQEGLGYVLQGSGLGMKDSMGASAKPDVIVNLPDGKHIIIDAKVSLKSYEQYCSEADDAVRAPHLRDFLRSVRNHVTGLSGKNYSGNEKLHTPDFVLLFMPIEGAYSLALQQDLDLHAFAWSQKIVIVCPSTLFATLRTITSLWNIEQQNRNVKEIARQSGALYDKFVGLLDDLKKVGSQLGTVQNTYESAMNKLSTGTGNLVGRVEKLRALGATTKSNIPKELLTSEVEEA